MAELGLSTRKGADELIESGLVSVNGKKALLGQQVEETDEITIRGPKRHHRYFAYNKPAGVITHSPREGEKDISSATTLKGVFPVGRLDKRSQGLIILTDDARVTDRLLNPRFVHEKEYRVRARDTLPANFRKRMESGVDIEGYTTKPCKVNIIGEQSFTITLTEGKKHQIRRMAAALNVNVADLERVRIMNIRLGTLQPGTHRSIEGADLKTFLRSLGL